MNAVWRDRLSQDALKRLALGLAVGTAGGAVAWSLDVPLAWMLGALFACMFASIAGLPVAVPLWLRANFMVLIGLFLGESFDGLTMAELARWPVSILGAILYVPVAGWLAYLFFRHVAKEDRVTAVCSGIPGGLTALVLIAGGMGADERHVALAQSLRIAIVVCLAPVIAFGYLGLTPPTPELFAERQLIGVADFVLLLVAAILATLALQWLRLPIPFLLGPILASAVLRIAGVVEGVLPHILVEVALVVTGSSIGTRFHGVAMTDWLRFAAYTFGGTLVLMAVSVVFAQAISALTGIDYFVALLAYAPGGIAEMSLIALAIDADPAFVALHHVVRITFILLAVPAFGVWLRRQVQDNP
ncbi:MAG: AbrB family transcriptional regulator [Pseudomonadota bacterium]